MWEYLRNGNGSVGCIPRIRVHPVAFDLPLSPEFVRDFAACSRKYYGN